MKLRWITQEGGCPAQPRYLTIPQSVLFCNCDGTHYGIFPENSASKTPAFVRLVALLTSQSALLRQGRSG